MPTFDSHHPPDERLLKDCVHCGFCLPACPTYVLWGEEMDSPRGRIHLMKQGRDGAALTPAMVRHFDRCLGCLACVPACPSGVQYGALIEATRQQVERLYPRPAGDRLLRSALFLLLPHPARLRAVRAALGLYHATGARRAVARLAARGWLPARLQAFAALAPPFEPPAPVAAWTPAAEPARLRVGLLLGCVQRVFFSGVNAATTRVLAAEGCGVAAPADQGCCGALSLHAGREREARHLARALVDRFEAAAVERVVVNAAGCGAVMKDYGRLLADDPAYAARARRFAANVRDVSELLAELGPRVERRALPLAVVYHDACHLAHAQGVRAAPRALLAQIPGLELREPAEADLCCGSAGTYNLLEPRAARDLGDRKARHLLAAGAHLVVTSNPGCLLQIRSGFERLGRATPVVHLADVIDASMRGDATRLVPAAGPRGLRR